MSLSSIQPFLEQAFGFLCDRGFSANREEWKKFYTAKGTTLEQLNAGKSELLTKLKRSGDGEKTELLQQIFCCDPFDEEIAKTLRDNWHERADSEPNPYQGWFADLSIHLLGLSSESKTPPSPPLSSPNVVTSPAPSSAQTVQSFPFLKELITAIIGGSIVGLFMIGTILIINKQSITTIAPKVSPSSPEISHSSPKISQNNQSLGWIWLGAINNNRGIFSSGDPLMPTETQPVTITPSIVPAIGSVVTLKTAANRRIKLPQPPNFKLPEKGGEPLLSGQTVRIIRLEGFVEKNSYFTRIWAEIGNP